MRKLNEWDIETLIGLVRHEIEYTEDNLEDEKDEKILEKLEKLEEKLIENLD